MNAGRAFALLFVVVFFGVGLVPKDSPIYYVAGFIRLAGFAGIAWHVTHPTRR